MESTEQSRKPSTLLPLATLAKLAEENNQGYSTASPYAHLVADNVFDIDVLDDVLREFEESDNQPAQVWTEYDGAYEKKLQMNSDLGFGSVTRAFIHDLNSEPFLEFLTELTGIDGLIPDPYLKGGGLHKIPRGGKLGIHVDFNRHKQMRVYRRLNVIVYLNKDWKEEYGGHFELWDEQKNGCQKKVLPIFNRMAIFSTTSKSFHGHPEPLNCPEDRYRRSLALYYYTAEEKGEQEASKHSTIFLDEDGKRVKDANSFSARVLRKLGFQK